MLGFIFVISIHLLGISMSINNASKPNKKLSIFLDFFLKIKMSLNELSLPLVNWPLFIFTSLIIVLRAHASSICLWILNRYYSPSIIIDEITDELKNVTNELKNISQQDEFAAYTRKERQRNLLVQRLKDERNKVETKQKNLLTSIRIILNIGTILIMILLTIIGRRHQLIPLFNFPFFHFPLIIWLMALNTFVTTLPHIYLRYRTNKKSTD